MMKRFVRRSMLFSASGAACLLSFFAQAQLPQHQTVTETVVFSTPAQYCFPHSLWRGGLTKATLDYQLVIPKDDQFKTGDVYVVLRRKSMPNTSWLLSGLSWVEYDASKEPSVYPYWTSMIGTQLQPVIPIYIIYSPTDLTALSGDVQVWVGYGLRKDAATTTRDSFQDMISNQRYAMVWEINPYAPPDAQGQLCLTSTQLTLYPDMTGTAVAQQPPK